MIQIGQHNTLRVIKDTEHGLFLGDGEGNEVLLPGKYIPEGASVGDDLEVFVYKDGMARLIATTLKPVFSLNEFAYLEVKSVTTYGAFLGWGIEKDLLVPYREQAQGMEEGKSYVVYLYLDEKSERLVGSTRLNRFLDNEELTVSEGDEVDLLITKFTDMGANVIINNCHRGIVYKNEIFANIKVGDRRKGFVKFIRPSHKIDITLQKQGFDEHVEPTAAHILELLKLNEGYLPLTDKSPPEEIYKQLEMSKKTFKRAIGTLYRQRLIRMEEDGIALIAEIGE